MYNIHQYLNDSENTAPVEDHPKHIQEEVFQTSEEPR